MKTSALAIVLCLICSPAFAADQSDVVPVMPSLQPDKGYVLVRSFHERVGGLFKSTAWYSPLLIRVLSPQELEHAKAIQKTNTDDPSDFMDPNVAIPIGKGPIALDGNKDYQLVAVRPGTYIIGGLASGVGVSTFFAMGTVKFEVKAGTITDMGTMFSASDAAPTTIPALTKVVLGKPIGDTANPFDVVIDPTLADIPPVLASYPHVMADYHAYGPFPNYLGAPLNRLTPLAGVLAYDKDGNVIDLKATPAPAQ
ncbi:MAG TPA: hypothetical protein VHL34_15250 [Rhizomicrobium sp.]|jgi:hypothetical protein|nr:hypothetical protein [Rhizomicrobium sp.]